MRDHARHSSLTGAPTWMEPPKWAQLYHVERKNHPADPSQPTELWKTTSYCPWLLQGTKFGSSLLCSNRKLKNYPWLGCSQKEAEWEGKERGGARWSGIFTAIWFLIIFFFHKSWSSYQWFPNIGLQTSDDCTALSGKSQFLKLPLANWFRRSEKGSRNLYSYKWFWWASIIGDLVSNWATWGWK